MNEFVLFAFLLFTSSFLCFLGESMACQSAFWFYLTITNSFSDKIWTGDLPSAPTSSFHCIFVREAGGSGFIKDLWNNYPQIPQGFLKDSSKISSSILTNQNLRICLKLVKYSLSSECPNTIFPHIVSAAKNKFMK